MRLLHCFQKHSSQLCPLLGPSAALIIKAASACFYCSMPSLLRSLEQSYPDQDWFDVGFPTGRDSATFRDKGTEVPSLSRDKGTTGQAKNLAKGRDGPGQPKFGTGRAGTAKIRDGTRDKTGQSRKGRSKTGK